MRSLTNPRIGVVVTEAIKSNRRRRALAQPSTGGGRHAVIVFRVLVFDSSGLHVDNEMLICFYDATAGVFERGDRVVDGEAQAAKGTLDVLRVRQNRLDGGDVKGDDGLVPAIARDKNSPTGAAAISQLSGASVAQKHAGYTSTGLHFFRRLVLAY